MPTSRSRVPGSSFITFSAYVRPPRWVTMKDTSSCRASSGQSRSSALRKKKKQKKWERRVEQTKGFFSPTEKEIDYRDPWHLKVRQIKKQPTAVGKKSSVSATLQKCREFAPGVVCVFQEWMTVAGPLHSICTSHALNSLRLNPAQKKKKLWMTQYKREWLTECESRAVLGDLLSRWNQSCASVLQHNPSSNTAQKRKKVRVTGQWTKQNTNIRAEH